MSSTTRQPETSVVVTPATLKAQIITRINTLLSKKGGKYYPTDSSGNGKSVAVIEGKEVRGLESKGLDVYLMVERGLYDTDGFRELIPYNAAEFYIEQLWEVYMRCEPIYTSKFTDYANFQE